MKLKKLLLLKGLPASGKSTYAKELANSGWLRVNKDDLRAMLHNGKWSKRNEDVVLTLRDDIILQGMMNGAPVVVDDTNLHPKHEETIRRMVADFNTAGIHEYTFETKFFDVSVDECIKRDLARPVSVGAKVIRDMHNQFLRPAVSPPTYIEDAPNVLIVDIDGTLAHMTNRSPYDYTKVSTDTLDSTVAELVRTYDRMLDVGPVIVSGRDASCRSDTEKWLKDNHIRYRALYMRDAGDKRDDRIVKQEIYDNNIKGVFNVLFVLDDRDRVVRMWRDNGLKVLQVAEGDF
jgi:predicted kinase